jgi:hypothetical protein
VLAEPVLGWDWFPGLSGVFCAEKCNFDPFLLLERKPKQKSIAWKNRMGLCRLNLPDFISYLGNNRKF